jgi:menaquinol-cytochrome c reductase iron-sulfur subunit
MADVGATDEGPARIDEQPESPERRRFMMRMSLWLSGLTAALTGLPILGYLLAPLINPPEAEWIDLGPIDSFPVGDTRQAAFTDISPLPYAGLTSATAVYVRRAQPQQFTVFAVNCTHLGCPINWLASARLFLCPCHGGVFYADGTVAAGPPQHPLYEYNTRVEANRLYVRTRPLPPAQPWDPPRLPRIGGRG